MTREEKIAELINIRDNFNYTLAPREVFDDAIKVLEQEPCGDTISRQATIEAFQMFRGYEANRTNAEWVDRIETVVKKLPPVNPQPKTGQFAKWVATEIFDDNWEYNKDAFAELACRKLAELGIVRAKGEEWELVDSQESEDEEGEQPKIIKCPNCGNVQFADKEWCPDCGCRMVEPQESEGI